MEQFVDDRRGEVVAAIRAGAFHRTLQTLTTRLPGTVYMSVQPFAQSSDAPSWN